MGGWQRRAPGPPICGVRSQSARQPPLDSSCGVRSCRGGVCSEAPRSACCASRGHPTSLGKQGRQSAVDSRTGDGGGCIRRCLRVAAPGSCRLTHVVAARLLPAGPTDTCACLLLLAFCTRSTALPPRRPRPPPRAPLLSSPLPLPLHRDARRASPSHHGTGAHVPAVPAHSQRVAALSRRACPRQRWRSRPLGAFLRLLRRPFAGWHCLLDHVLLHDPSARQPVAPLRTCTRHPGTGRIRSAAVPVAAYAWIRAATVTPLRAARASPVDEAAGEAVTLQALLTSRTSPTPRATAIAAPCSLAPARPLFPLVAAASASASRPGALSAPAPVASLAFPFTGVHCTRCTSSHTTPHSE